MSEPENLQTHDYPLAENQRARVRGPRGKGLDELTLEAVLAGEVDMQDFRITAEALRAQAQIARACNRATLAANFERAAEMVALPQPLIMEIYELLRPGRSRDPAPLRAAAARLRDEFAAERLAVFLEEAAEVYARRGLFEFRF